LEKIREKSRFPLTIWGEDKRRRGWKVPMHDEKKVGGLLI